MAGKRASGLVKAAAKAAQHAKWQSQTPQERAALSKAWAAKRDAKPTKK